MCSFFCVEISELFGIMIKQICICMYCIPIIAIISTRAQIQLHYFIYLYKYIIHPHIYICIYGLSYKYIIHPPRYVYYSVAYSGGPRRSGRNPLSFRTPLLSNLILNFDNDVRRKLRTKLYNMYEACFKSRNRKKTF